MEFETIGDWAYEKDPKVDQDTCIEDLSLIRDNPLEFYPDFYEFAKNRAKKILDITESELVQLLLLLDLL